MAESTENAVQECEPIVHQLKSFYSDRNASGMEATLDKMIEESRASALRQDVLGTIDSINTLISILKVTETPAAKSERSSEVTLEAHEEGPIQSEKNFSVFSSEQQQRLVEKCFWTLVRLCRREMDKSTVNSSNIELIENQLNFFEIFKLSATRFVACAGIALPAAWLVMILASDSAERQFKLTAAGATQLIVDIINEHLGDDSVSEMACRAARNLAAGETDLVAKLVEDKVCKALVSVIRTQLRMPLIANMVETSTVNEDANETVNGDAVAATEGVAGVEGVKEVDNLRPLVEGDQPINEAVCEAVLWAIVNLACDENVATILGAEGGVEAVVDLSYKCRHNSSISLAAVSAIRNISSVGTLNYSLLARTHVCHVLLMLIENHRSDLDFVETALWTITNLSCNAVLSNRLGSLGAANLIVDLYFRYTHTHTFVMLPST